MQRFRRLRMLLVILAVAALALPSPALGEGGSFTRHTYPNGNHTRDYLLYVPAGAGAGSPVLVYLHGCSQTAADAAVGTRFNRLADERGFIVVYPEQLTTPNQAQGNGIGCWNWFRPDHQMRDAGEPATLAGITRTVVDTYGADPRRVYVHGASAGADMAVVMGATYPDVYAAVGALAGCPYASCLDATGGLAYVAMGPRARTVPVFIGQGTHDTTNPMPAGAMLVEQWLGSNDLADDGLTNGSDPRLADSSESHDAAEGNGYAYTVDHYVDAHGCALLDYVLVTGLGHAYPSGDPAGSFTDPRGPDATAAAWDFFAAQVMPEPGAPPSVCSEDPEPPSPGPTASGGGWLAGADGEKIHFSLEITADDSGLGSGELRLRDPGVADVRLTDVLYAGAVAVECGEVVDGQQALQVIGLGTVDGQPAQLLACVEDRGDPGHSRATATPDRIHVECLAGCTYSLTARVADEGIDAGNVTVTPRSTPAQQRSSLGMVATRSR